MENPWKIHGKKIHGKITRVFNGNDDDFPMDFPMDARGFPRFPATLTKLRRVTSHRYGWLGVVSIWEIYHQQKWPSKIVGNMMINHKILSFTEYFSQLQDLGDGYWVR